MSTLNPFEDPNFDGSVKQGTPNPFADPNFSGRDGALVRGAKTMSKNVGISAGLVSGDTAETAKRVAELDAYSKLNPKSKERQALGDAFEKGDGFFGGLKGAVNQIGENYNKAGSFVGGLRSLGRDAYAMGEAVVEQTPNMLLPTAGMIAGGAAGSYVPVVGTAIGAFAGGAAGNTMVEGGSQVMDALAKANINPSDTAAVKAYLDKNGDKILGQSAVKGSVLGAVDVATAGLGHGILNAPIKEATGRALKEMGVDMADKAAVKAAMNSPAMAERLGADAILKQQSTGLRNIGRNAGAAALEPAGEFTGEFVGQGLATGDWDTKGAGLEALSSIGQSGAMYAGQKAVQFATAPKISIDNTQQQSDGTQPPVAPTTTPGAPPVATPPAGPTLGQSLTGTPMADLMGGGGLTGGANPLQAGLSTLTSNNQMYPGMNTEPAGYTVDPETGAIIPADPVGARQMAEPAAQPQQKDVLPPFVPEFSTELGAAPTKYGNEIDMPRPEFDTSGLRIEYPVPAITPAQRMGLNPANGPLSAAATIAANTLTGSNPAGMLGRASDPLLSGISDRRVAAENDAQRKAEEEQRRFEQARSGTLLSLPAKGSTLRPLSVEDGMNLIYANANGRALIPQEKGFLDLLRKEMGDDAYEQMAQVAAAPFLFKKQARDALIKPNKAAIEAWDASNASTQQGGKAGLNLLRPSQPPAPWQKQPTVVPPAPAPVAKQEPFKPVPVANKRPAAGLGVVTPPAPQPPQGTPNGTQAAQAKQTAPQRQGEQAQIGGTPAMANAMPVAEGLGASSAPAVQGGPIPAVQVQQGVASHVTAGSKPSKADNLAALQQKLAGQTKPTPATPPAQTKATPAPEAGPTNQGATNGQRQETLLKAEQPTGARTVNAAPVSEAQSDDPLLSKLAAGYGYQGGIDTMPDGLGKTARKLHKAIIQGDEKSVQEILHPDNKQSRKAFEKLFDGRVKLPSTVKGTQEVVKDFIGKVSAAVSSSNNPAATGKPSGAPVSEPPASKAENLAKIKQASQAGRKDAEPSDYWSNPKLNSHEHGGRADFKAGKPRTLPGYFTEPRGGNAKAWLRGWDKAKADSEMAPAKDSAPAKPPAPTQPATGRKPVGKNEDGKQLEQDERGVRSYVEDGIRITEPVAMRPGRAGVSVSVENRRDEFKTVDELGQKAAAPTQSTETLMQAAKNNGKLVVANVGDKPSAKPAAPAPAADSILDDELKDALGKLGDVLGDVFGSKLNVTGPQYTAGDLLPALSKVVELLVKKGFKSFSQSIGKAAQLMRADQRTAAHVDSISPRQWKAAYNAIADGFEGTDSEDAISALKSDEVLAIVATKVAQKPEAPSIQNAAQEKTLAESLYQAIKANQMPKDNPALKKLVEAFDGKPADQARMKQAQEALETAITMMARDLVAKKEGNRSTFDMLLRLYESQPNLNIRTSTSIANQAYSTPAPLAWLASQLAGITKDTVAHEPTGGNGMLLIAADPSKAIVNELNDLRIDALKAQGFKPTQKDAATQQLVPDGVKPDSVVTNPPFGSIKDADGKPVKVKVDGFSLGQIDHLIAARALDTMKDDGRATLIIGANKVAGGLSTDDRIFFNWLYSHYNVAGHFEVEGDLYNRQGAGWPVRVITINGRQKSDKFSPVAGSVQRVDNWNAVYEQFTKSLESSKNQAVIGTTTAVDGSGARPSITAATPAKSGEEKPAGGTSSTGNVSGASAGAVSNRAEPAAIAVGDSPDEQRLNAQPFVPQPQPGQNHDGAARPEKPVGTAAVSEAKGNEFQAPYTPRSARKDDGVLIPSNMAQPTQDALSKLEDEVGDIDEFARKELGYATVSDLHNALMGLQVDSVATSIYQIKKGKAVVIADQTGIGKGRQAASIIRWAALQGMTPVFVSVKPSLFTDMYGDLADIGTNDVSPFIMNGDAWVAGEGGSKLFANKPGKHKQAIQEIANSGQLPDGSNALFMTYSQINVANVQRQALMALAPNAVFVLDESHNAAGASSTGEFVISALEAAKGVVYLSATYAKRPDNMPLYFKTDIGEAAADTEGLADAMASGGLPLQTVVSNNLVKAGQMFRRERSYEGVSIASVFDSPNRALHERMSNEATKALRAIASADSMFHEVYVKQLSEQLAESGATVIDSAGNQIEQSVQHTEFSSVVHNFVKQMLLGLKAQSAADEAIASLKRGEKPIIAVENTMGSFLTEYAAANGIGQGDSLGSFDYRTVLTRALARSRVVIEVAPNGDKVKRQVRFDQLDPVTQAAYRDAQAVIDGLTLNIPVSPIDWMRSEIIRAGFKVAEITGRNLSVDYGNPKKPVLSAIDATEQKDKVNTTRQFNSGSLDALILNVAGSTGISLHASEKFADQRQRHMIVAQAAGDINIFMQMLGRVHRTGQVRLPKYTILSVDLPTEKRPTAVLSIKMKSLNANTSSNTESATSVKSLDILNKYGDQIVNQYLSDNYALARELGLESDIGENPTEDIARKATGRLALQPIDTQHAFYDDVEAQYTALIDYLNKTNQNDLEPRTFDFDAKETRQEVLFDGPDKDSPFGEDAIYGEYSIKAQGSPMKPDEIRAAMSENLGGMLPVAHTQKMLDELDAKFNAYWSTLDDGGKDSASSVRSVGRDFLREHRIGSTFRVDINSEPFNAVVLNVRNMHKETGNPYSMSKIQVTVAVNGALRSISVPATQFRKIEVSSISPSFRVEQLFKEQPPNQRETAKIVTGNLLAAYGELQGVRGTIINFTKQDGTVDQGILLPKLFDYTKNTRGDYHLKDGESALKFLQKSENKDVGRFGIMTRDGNVRVLPSGQGIRVQVPKSKLKGAKYFLDKGLIEVGGDFVTQGAYMVATVQNPSDAVKMLDLLMKKQALYTLPSMAEEAKAITVSKPEGATDANQKPSVSRAKEQPLTPASTIRTAITKAYGNLLGKLEAKGLVTIAQTEREAIEAAAQARADKTGGDAEAIAGRMMSMAGLDVKYSANGNIEGFFDKQTGKSFLVADNLTAASAPGTLMHEVGIHMAAGGKMEALFKRAGSLLKTGTQNEFIQRVKARMARAGETSDEEAAAYIVTEYENDRAKAPITIGKWLADLTAAVRAWLFSKGIILKADQLTVADIAAVARANARSMARGGPNGGPGGGQSFQRGTNSTMTENKASNVRSLLDIDGWEDMPEFQDDEESTVLFNGGSSGYIPVVKDMSNSASALWPGLFSSADVEKAHGPGMGSDITAFRIQNEKMANDFDDFDQDEVMDGLKKLLPKRVERQTSDDEDLMDVVWRAVVDDRFEKVQDEFSELFGLDLGEAGWEAQSLRGRLATALGLDAIAMRDEHGTSWYISPGVKSIPLPVQEDAGGQAFSRTEQQSDPDIRLSRAADIADSVQQGAFSVKNATADQLAHYRGMGMQALGRRQIVDLYGDMLPELKQYDKLVQRMDADANESGADADKLVNEWAKLDERSTLGLGAAKQPGMERKLAELMHDATLAQIDPEKPLQAGDNADTHKALAARFAALTPKAQDVYRTARDMYAAHFKKVQAELQARIQRSGMDEKSKAKMIAKMDADLFGKLKGVYFPLARFGKYVVVSKNAAGETVSVSRAETLAEANNMRREVVKNSPAGVTVSRVYKDAEFNATRDAAGKGFMSDLMTMLQGQGVSADVLDSVGQLYLSSLPDLSWAKHGIHRKGTPGFSQDARRAFAQNMFHGARHLAKVRYSDQLADKLLDMEQRVKDQRDDEAFDQIKAQQVVDEMNKRHELLMNPKTSSVSTAMTSVGFVWFLGLSPASALVNLSQTALVAYPVMASKWGFQKAGAALLSASAEVARAGNDLSKALSGEELAAFQKAVDHGAIDVTQAHDLAGVAQGEDERVAMAMRPVMRAASFMFHHAEKFNRQATFIAAYRLAKESGAGADSAFEQATKATYDGHFDYAASNRARIMQGNWQKVLFLFKQYGQSMVYTLTRQAYLSMKGMTDEQKAEARKQLGGLLVMHAMAAGALGLPIVGMLLSAASMLGSDDDEPWDAEVALKNTLADAVGPKAAEVMAHGLSRLTPWDLSGRVALNKLILPDIQEGLEGTPLWEKMLSAAAGPVAGIGGGIAKGMAEMGRGQYMRGLESMMPVALRNPIKAMRYAEEGSVDKTGVVIKDEVSLSGVVGQFSGFRPSDVALATEGRTAIYQANKALTDRRANIVRMYAQARMTDDAEGVQEVLKMVRSFNEKNPSRRITMPQLMQSVRGRTRRIEQAQQGVYLPKTQRDVVDAGRFAVLD